MMNNMNNLNNNLINNDGINNNLNDSNMINNNKETFMPVMPLKRNLGPYHNFHEIFNKNLNNLKFKELGWRNWWDKNKRKNKLNSKTGFEGTIIKNYLNNLDNTNNMFLVK